MKKLLYSHMIAGDCELLVKRDGFFEPLSIV